MAPVIPIQTLTDNADGDGDWFSHLLHGICLLFWHLLRLPYDIVVVSLRSLWELSGAVVEYFGFRAEDENVALVFICFSLVIIWLARKLYPALSRFAPRIHLDDDERAGAVYAGHPQRWAPAPNERTHLVVAPRGW